MAVWAMHLLVHMDPATASRVTAREATTSSRGSLVGLDSSRATTSSSMAVTLKEAMAVEPMQESRDRASSRTLSRHSVSSRTPSKAMAMLPAAKVAGTPQPLVAPPSSTKRYDLLDQLFLSFVALFCGQVRVMLSFHASLLFCQSAVAIHTPYFTYPSFCHSISFVRLYDRSFSFDTHLKNKKMMISPLSRSVLHW